MAIEGRLRELALSDVLQLLDLSRKTGVLTLQRDGSDTPSALVLEQGALVGAVGHGKTRRIGELLLFAGKVTQAQIDRAVVEQRRQPGRRMGSILVELEAVTAADVQRQLRFQIEELVFELARWPDGHFRFEESPPSAEDDVGVRIRTESVLMEVARRMDEWSQMVRGTPDTELVPSLVEAAPGGALLELQPAEWEVLACIDGERPLRAVAREVGRGEFEVAKAVFALVAAGVVEVGSRRRSAGRRRDGAALEKAEVESALEAGRLEEAERRIKEILRRDGEGAEPQVLQGRLEIARGRWNEAVRCLAEAARLDPLLAPVYFYLGVALVRDGELERGEQALRTYLRLADPADEQRLRAERAARAVAELRYALSEAAA